MEAPNHDAQSVGHQPNVGDLLREIYELLSFFLSSQRIAELEQSSLYGTSDPIHQFVELERDLITEQTHHHRNNGSHLG